eukprot:860338-Pyramimonas_sp.AAC.1
MGYKSASVQRILRVLRQNAGADVTVQARRSRLFHNFQYPSTAQLRLTITAEGRTAAWVGLPASANCLLTYGYSQHGAHAKQPIPAIPTTQFQQSTGGG